MAVDWSPTPARCTNRGVGRAGHRGPRAHDASPCGSPKTRAAAATRPIAHGRVAMMRRGAVAMGDAAAQGPERTRRPRPGTGASPSSPPMPLVAASGVAPSAPVPLPCCCCSQGGAAVRGASVSAALR